MKKKVLMVTEFSELPTGYSVYSKELLTRLNKEFEVAELAAYVSANDPKLNNVRWQVFPNKPLESAPEYNSYKQSPIAEFGEFSFNSVVLQFKPDFVIDIRDFWMLSYEQSSPYRQFYNWAIMPTVDAKPQNMEWVETYESADAVFTYSEFGEKTLKSQGKFNNFRDVASPCASHSFFPIKNKTGLRNEFGLESAPYIVGTVMRNQRRKLYPDLFSAFRNFLNKSKREDVFLYCHTSYPDVGWDIPKLLIQNNLTHKVLFTYKCSKCGHVDCAFFSDVMKNCKKCGGFSSGICGINNPVNEKELAKIYNVFDIYVQYANSEGFGMPQLEAAQCGNVVCSVDYSAMHSVIRNINGYPILYKHLETEVETGCLRAIPNEQHFIDLLVELTSKTKEELKNIGLEIYRDTISRYNWDKTAEKWASYIRETPTLPIEQTWRSPINIKQPAPIKNLLMPLDQANFLVSEVLCKPELIGSFLWRRLLKELTYKSTVENLGGFYINEHHYKDALKMKSFTYTDAYNSMVQLREYYNIWEQHRANSL